MNDSSNSSMLTFNSLESIVGAADSALDSYKQAKNNGDVQAAEVAWTEYRTHLGYVLDSVDVLLATKA